jgi:hypothetical protein
MRFTSWLRLQGSDQVSTLRGYNGDPNRFTQLRIWISKSTLNPPKIPRQSCLSPSPWTRASPAWRRVRPCPAISVAARRSHQHQLPVDPSRRYLRLKLCVSLARREADRSELVIPSPLRALGSEVFLHFGQSPACMRGNRVDSCFEKL